MRIGPPSCAHGYCAVGLPAGSVVSVLPERRYALRPALGSAAIVKLPRKNLEAAEAARVQRRRMALIEEKRQATLIEMRAVGARPRTGPYSACCSMDSDSSRRGQCQQCNGCPGYCAAEVDAASAGKGSPTLSLHCVHCGAHHLPCPRTAAGALVCPVERSA